MKKLSQWLLYIAIFALFVGTRLWILQHPPAEYSDVKHDYERYANIWRYGLMPYRQIIYEYPPATVPLVSFPLELDQRGIGKYYINYRVQIFVFECLLFAVLLYELKKQKLSSFALGSALTFYLFAGVLAKDFWYEGLDLLFFGIITVMIVWMQRRDQRTLFMRFVTWFLFWFSVAIKLITFPLVLPLFFFSKLKWKKELMICAAGFLFVWIIPLLIYRSSLSVFLVFHAQRPMKYGAFGSYIVEIINDFTKTEYRLDQGPDFPMVGPVASAVTNIDKIVFPLAIGGLMIGVSFILWKRWKIGKVQEQWMLPLVMVYIFVFFLTTKTFSSPFHLWYVPLLTIYPFRSLKKRWFAYFFALLMLGLDTSPYLKVPNTVVLYPITLPHLRDMFRFIPMFILLGIFSQDLIQITKTKSSEETMANALRSLSRSRKVFHRK